MNAAGDALEKAIHRAHWGMEWWFILTSVAYIAARVLPWALAGFPVVGR